MFKEFREDLEKLERKDQVEIVVQRDELVYLVHPATQGSQAGFPACSDLLDLEEKGDLSPTKWKITLWNSLWAC